MIWWNEKSYVRRVMVREMRVRVVMVVSGEGGNDSGESKW